MPELIVKLGDNIVQRYVIDKDLISIGRAKDNDIVIENLSVSRNHARIKRQGSTYVLTDLNSSNGTFVNNVRITKTEILDGDVITIGKHRIEFVNKELSDSDLIVEALAADRTMVIDRSTVGTLVFTEGRLKGKEFSLTKPETTIGKSASNDIVIADDWFVAKRQSVIIRHGNEYEIRDLGTLRKTRLNGKPIVGTQKLNDGDILEIGGEKCVFRMAVPGAGEVPSGRIPKELGLDDSVFGSVSELPPEMQPTHGKEEEEIIPQPAPVSLEESEDWSDAAKLIEQEAAAFSVKPEPIQLEDIALVGESKTFSREEIEQSASSFERPQAEQGSLQQDDASGVGPSQPGKPQRLSRRKQRELEKRAMRQEQAAVFMPEVGEQAPSLQSAEVEGAQVTTEPEHEQRAPEMLQEKVTTGSDRSLTKEEEIALWEAALGNKSPVIRRQAAKMLKKLTGKDYAY
jgi:pSer/pThr/pTyr-binding forkhead associated (FHA) protein